MDDGDVDNVGGAFFSVVNGNGDTNHNTNDDEEEEEEGDDGDDDDMTESEIVLEVNEVMVLIQMDDISDMDHFKHLPCQI